MVKEVWTEKNGIPIVVQVDDDAEEHTYSEGIPTSIDYEYLKDWYNLNEEVASILAHALKKEGVIKPQDLWRNGIYKQVGNALKRTFVIMSNDIVNRLRGEYNHDGR